jgi:SAM-dependent methyltransferase
MSLKDTYNKIAEDWYKDHCNDSGWKVMADNFISLVGKNGLVLDVGCGAGLKAKYLQARGVKVIGIDFSEEMIKIARKEAPGGDFRVLDVYNLDSLKEKFDGIFAQAVLLHFPKNETAKIIRKLIDRLKPGGFFYLAVKELKPGADE